MTPDQLRRIDALVAVHVMGWELEGKIGNISGRQLLKSGKGELVTSSMGWYETAVPEFSRDLAWAWKVVEKLRDYDSVFTLHDSKNTIGYDTHQWHCMIGYTRPEFDFRKAGAGADTAPLAICLAALKAKGISIPEGNSDTHRSPLVNENLVAKGMEGDGDAD